MFEHILIWLKGYLIICITGISKERFLNICAKNGIILWNMNTEDKNVIATVSRKQFEQLKGFADKTNVKIEIKNKKGLPFFFYKYKKRKIFILGVLFCIGILYMFSNFIWKINIIGAGVYTEEQILKDIKSNYYSIGTSIDKINCSELEKELRDKYDKVAWISCEIKGTELNIVFTETIEQDTVSENKNPCNIVATKDGVITEIITRGGVPMVFSGDEVKKGDVLITGVVNIYNDFDELMETTYVPASGDVYAVTKYMYEDTFSLNYYEKEYTGKSKKYFSFNFGEYIMTPYKPKIVFENYDVISKDEQLKILSHIYLPISIKKHNIKEYNTKLYVLNDEEAKEKAKIKLELYLQELRKKGVEILENNVKIDISEGMCNATGYIVVKELIGVPADLTIIEQQGDNH